MKMKALDPKFMSCIERFMAQPNIREHIEAAIKDLFESREGWPSRMVQELSHNPAAYNVLTSIAVLDLLLKQIRSVPSDHYACLPGGSYCSVSSTSSLSDFNESASFTVYFSFKHLTGINARRLFVESIYPWLNTMLFFLHTSYSVVFLLRGFPAFSSVCGDLHRVSPAREEVTLVVRNPPVNNGIPVTEWVADEDTNDMDDMDDMDDDMVANRADGLRPASLGHWDVRTQTLTHNNIESGWSNTNVAISYAVRPCTVCQVPFSVIMKPQPDRTLISQAFYSPSKGAGPTERKYLIPFPSAYRVVVADDSLMSFVHRSGSSRVSPL